MTKDIQKPSKNSSTRPPVASPGQKLEVVINRLDEEGCGIGLYEGIPVLVHGVLPDEKVKVRVELVAKRGIIAKLISVTKPSSERVNPQSCEIARNCESCPLIQMDYAAQLAWKQQLVKDQINSYSSLATVPVEPVLPSPKQTHYRNSAKLVIAGRFATPIIGIYRRNSHDVLDISDCHLHHPLINRIVAAVKEGITKGKVPIYNPRSQMGLLRYLVVRVAEKENRAMVVLVTSQRSYNELHHLSAHIQRQVPEVTVVAQNINASEGNVILGDIDLFLTKKKALEASIGNRRFLISPRSFFQVNSGSAQLIYELVRDQAQLTGKENILDLYCGIGGIALFLAGSAKEVLGIEVVEDAVGDAEQNCKLNRVRNCSFVAGDVARILQEVGESDSKIDLIILNPPRKGCDEDVLKQAATLNPRAITYVSCSPKSLSRDLNILAELGYRTSLVQPVDMFPQTPHIENVAFLVKQ